VLSYPRAAIVIVQHVLGIERPTTYHDCSSASVIGMDRPLNQVVAGPERDPSSSAEDTATADQEAVSET